MSIDLEWGKLDASLASYLVDVLNRQLTNAERPSFIGPVEVTSLEFGSTAPDVELVDLRDIYRDFLEDEDEDDFDRGPVKLTEGAEDEEGFEWVPRRVGTREEGLAYRHLPPHVRYGSAMNEEHSANLHHSSFGASSDPLRTTTEQVQPPQAQHPNLQVHLHVNWHSDLRITLTTSLLINYPSPMFMSLPIKLSITGLVFNGELAVAYEGERRRVHICILDDLDPYGPAGARPKRGSVSSTPPDLDDDSPAASIRPSKPLPVGQRLLPSIYIESEIGQADKHVLKNVTRVERFIQDVIRKTVEEELVFPNFHTLVMGGQNA
ncbi:Mitochondrial distribution and morphology protein 12 [Termitomyces sp. J132]|nr:Mitochondrial distribution and morphology protein 12 [Termitomyces sp. J132]